MECGNWSSLEKKKRGRLYRFFSTSTRSKTIPLYSDQKDSSASDFFCFLSPDLKLPRMHSARPSGLVGASSAAIASEECSGNNWDSLTVVQRTNFTESNRMSSYGDIRLTRDRELSDLAAGAAPCHDGRSHEDMGGGHLPCHSPGNNSFQNMKAEMQQDVSLERCRDPPAKDEKKQKNELSPRSSNHKASSRNGKVSENADASKDDYIHVRSKRGQATNIHSLAERVRREKISERMKLLQDLVPGCNKINGKAMMLDEIINYVQSLQRQVEFLSMKLAAVHPEMNFDLHQMLPQDALRSCYSGSSVVAVGPGMSNFHSALYASSPYQRITQPEMPYVAHNSEDLQHSHMLQVSQLAQNLPSPWQDELHNMNPVPNEAATDQMHW